LSRCPGGLLALVLFVRTTKLIVKRAARASHIGHEKIVICIPPSLKSNTECLEKALLPYEELV
jgi:hypothetical protein